MKAQRGSQSGNRQYNDLRRGVKCRQCHEFLFLTALPKIESSLRHFLNDPMTTASKDTAETQPNSSRTGVWIVFSVLALGAVMAGGNFLFQYFSTYEALEYWGHDAAALFRSESTMTVALLEPSQSSATSNESGSAARTLTIAGERYVLTEERDASTAGGNLHFRRALLQQRMYDWTASPRVVTGANPE